MEPEARKGKPKSRAKIVVLAMIILAILVASKYFNVLGSLRNLLDWVSELGWVGAAIFAAAYVVACVAMAPASILTLGAGAVYGIVYGSILVSLASTIGATCAFLVGRYVARDWVSERLKAYPRFGAIDEAVGREGWKIVGLTRLSPLFPFNLLNYAFGLTKVRLRDYVLASWIGMLPGTVMYVYFGSVAGTLASLGSGEETQSPMKLALYVVGLIATIAVAVFVARIAKRAIEQQV